MATYTQVWQAIKDAAWLLYQDYRELVGPNAEKYLDHEADLKSAAGNLDVPNELGVVNALVAYRATRVGALLGARGLVDGALLQMGDVIGVPQLTPDGILERLDQYMRDQVPIDSVKRIGGSFGAPVAGTNAGNGVMVRTTVDRDGFPLEAGRVAETLTIRCQADMHGGMRPGQEVFSVEGEPFGPDILQISGSGINGQMTVDSADTSLLRNPSFGDLDGASAGALTSVPFWELVGASAGNFALSTTVHRTAAIEATGYSLRFDQGTTSTVQQGLRSAGVMVTDPLDEPWCFALWYNKNSGAGAGTLTLGLGAYSRTFAVASGASGWTRASLFSASPQQAFYPNWQANDVHASVKWSGPAGFLVDDVYLGPQRPFGGTWANLFAGSVDFLRDDEFTVSDSRSSNGAVGVVQWMFDLLYDRTLPNSSSPTISDPS